MSARLTTSTKGIRFMKRSIGLFTLLAALASAPSASAEFGILQINGDSGLDAPAFSGTDAAWAGTCDLASPSTANGAGAAPATRLGCIDTGQGTGASCEGTNTCRWSPGEEPAWRLDPVGEAGLHPDATASFYFTTKLDAATNRTLPEGNVKTIVTKVPAGTMGNPQALPLCSQTDSAEMPPTCPPETQVGVASLQMFFFGGPRTYPIYAVKARDGYTAEFVIGGVTQQFNVPLTARARTEGDFGVDVIAARIPTTAPIFGQTVTLWGVPWAAEHDKYRMRPGYMSISGTANSFIPKEGLPPADQVRYQPGWGPVKPFFSNPTECTGGLLTTTLHMDEWRAPAADIENPADPDVLLADMPTDVPVSDCADVPFDADLELAPTSSVADAPSGLDVGVSVAQNNDLPFDPPQLNALQSEVDEYVADAAAYWKSQDGLAAAHLKDTVVELPEGLAVNPSGATGLDGCSDAEMGVTNAASNPPLFDNDDPFDDKGMECPDGSKIGSVEVETPLLEETVTGEVVLGDPKSTDPLSGEMFRLFLVVRNEERALVGKIFGSAVADPATGRLTATFENNPRIPFDNLEVRIKGGQRGMLATPQDCGTLGWSSTMTPWTAAHGAGGVPVDSSGSSDVSSRCAQGFSPALKAGMSNPQGGGSGAFSFSFSRTDGQQWFKGLTAHLPTGLLAKVRDVPLCTNAQANANACPAASRIGTVDAGAGSGTPFFLEKKGTAFLTEGYKGAPYGLAVSVPVEAGPFRGQFALKPIVVRQALHVDRTTAQVTAVSDSFPQIWHGIPLRVRQVTVKVDRPGFMRNPSDCSAKEVTASILSVENAKANLSNRFQASGCSRLGFKPKLALRLTGKKQSKTNGHPGVRAIVTQTQGEAGIKRAQVRLPLSLALDPDNAQALCEFADGTKAEPTCPAGSIVGRARAESPLLKQPLTGNVYFVKNVRRSSTGNLIRTLPMIVVALRGEIAVNLRGVSSTTSNGRLVNTFDQVPDAPISKFNLNVQGGSSGILVVTRKRSGKAQTICGRQIAEADMDGHNGRAHDRDIRIKTPCKARKAAKSKKRTAAAKKRAAAKRKAARRARGR